MRTKHFLTFDEMTSFCANVGHPFDGTTIKRIRSSAASTSNEIPSTSTASTEIQNNNYDTFESVAAKPSAKAMSDYIHKNDLNFHKMQSYNKCPIIMDTFRHLL